MEPRSPLVVVAPVPEESERAPLPAAAAPGPRKGAASRRPRLLIGALVLQACAALYFVCDALAELWRDPGQAHPLTEVPVALALGIGILVTAAEVRRTLRQMGEQAAALEAARGAFSDLVRRQFQLWALTPAERDVGLLALKGMDVAEIAQARGAATGTVRAQLARIYAKAGVAGRTQFAAFFVEDLLAEGLATPQD